MTKTYLRPSFDLTPLRPADLPSHVKDAIEEVGISNLGEISVASRPDVSIAGGLDVVAVYEVAIPFCVGKLQAHGISSNWVFIGLPPRISDSGHFIEKLLASDFAQFNNLPRRTFCLGRKGKREIEVALGPIMRSDVNRTILAQDIAEKVDQSVAQELGHAVSPTYVSSLTESLKATLESAERQRVLRYILLAGATSAAFDYLPNVGSGVLNTFLVAVFSAAATFYISRTRWSRWLKSIGGDELVAWSKFRKKGPRFGTYAAFLAIGVLVAVI